MDLPKLINLDVYGKRVIVRADLDVDVTVPDEEFRLKALVPTLKYLTENKANVIIIGHKGRPNGVKVESLSLTGFAPVLGKLVGKEIVFEGPGEIVLKENLRFDPGEETNDPEFAKKLAALGDVYINEAFGNSHREHASMVGISKLLPHAAGFRFIKEVENLSKVIENPRRPLLFIIGGSKKDKLDYINSLKKTADKILVGGRLPEYLEQDTRYSILDTKILVANLMPDKEDLTINSIEKFEEEIKKAGTIVLVGPMGKYEDPGHRQGTEKIFKAVADSSAFKVAGGGDTEKAIMTLSLSNGFDWISVGGGAMLEFLTKKTLPGIEALL